MQITFHKLVPAQQVLCRKTPILIKALPFVRPPNCARRLRPERRRFSPSGKPIGALPQTPVMQLRCFIKTGLIKDFTFIE